MKRFLVITFIIFAAVCSAKMAHTATKDPIDVITAFLNDGYGRVIFDPEIPTNYKLETKNKTIEILFSHPIKENTDDVLQTLAGYIDNIERLDNGKKIQIEMTRAYPVRSFMDNGRIFVDILGAPLKTTEIKPKSIPDNKLLRVRTGAHSSYFRYVFDFNKLPKHQILEQEDKSILTFDGVFEFNKNKLMKKIPQELNPSNLSLENSSNTTQITLPGKARASFVNNNSLVVDVFFENPTPKVSDKIVPKAVPIKAVEKDELPQVKPDEANTDGEKIKEEIPKEQNTEVASKKVDKPKKTEVSSEDKAPVAEEEEVQPVAPETVSANKSVYLDDADFWKYSRIVSLSFPWNMQTSLAAFKRSGYIWLVFDNKKTMDFTMMMRMGGDVIKDMIQIPHSKGTVIRILTYPSFSPSVRREGFLWIVDLVQQPVRPQSQMDVIPIHSSPEGAKLFMPINNAGQMLSVVDPEIGDVIYAVPVFPLGKGNYPAKSYVDMDILESSQGIAIIPKNPYVNVRTSANGIEVTAPPDGLWLSSDADHLVALLALEDKEKISKNFDLRKWYRGGLETPNLDSFVLNNLMALAPKDKKNLARLEAARYYVAHNLPAEALGILRNIEFDKLENVEPASFYATRGMANFLMQRYQEAIDDFSNPDLINDEEAIFWRSAAEASISEPEKQINYLTSGSKFLKTYPQPVKGRLAMEGVKAALAAEEDLIAQNFLEMAYDENGSPSYKSQRVYYTAKWNEITGAYIDALNQFEDVIWYDGNRQYSAYSLRDKTLLELDIKRINLDQAIDVFEKLGIAWRGDDFEYGVLSKLTDFYLQKKEYKKAFDNLQKAINAFKDTDREKLIRDRMQQLFKELFVDGKADNMSPVKALAIFEDYKELIPQGKQGNELIKKLADRLVAVDLLDRAGSLLDDMITNRAEGLEKSVFGARLALIRLLDKKPKLALEALDKSEVKDIPPLLTMRRRHLRARSLADDGKAQEAIDLLKDDKSEDAILLRAEIYWHDNDWNNAADTIKMLIEKPTKDKPITEIQAKRILDWATALRLAGKDRVIMRLRHNFAPFMKETAHWEVFDLLTAGKDSGAANVDQIYDQIQDVEKFRSFMTDYVSRLRMGELKTGGEDQTANEEALSLQ